MDDKSLSGLFSGNASGKAGDGQDQNPLLVASLKAAAAGSSNEAVENEIGAFLKGEGNLLETASAALTRGGSSAATDVAKFLEEKFGLNPAIARVIGTLLINLLPGIQKKKAAKKKPRKKTRRHRQDTGQEETQERDSSQAQETCGQEGNRQSQTQAEAEEARGDDRSVNHAAP